VINLYRIYIR